MENVKMNWLSDEDGTILAPKTLVEGIQNAEGTSLEELLESSGGLPEVYIGDEEPTEEGIELFVDTSTSPEEYYTIAMADTPIGTIIAYMGNSAPKDYLICDGTEYEIIKYRDLAEHIKSEFGSYEYFGGDGETTFAIPDLRGEFLRGSGENSHENSGNGADVGEHQNATTIPRFYRGSQLYTGKGLDLEYSYDSSWGITQQNYFEMTANYYSAGSYESNATTRPTNTSVLYCIKYETNKKANEINKHTYSTDEQIVGTWIDGKSIYEKTFVFDFYLDGEYSNNVYYGNILLDENMSYFIQANGRFESTEINGTIPCGNGNRMNEVTYAFTPMLTSNKFYLHGIINKTNYSDRNFTGHITVQYIKEE